ncbi:MAG TPA: hypothetical protein VKT82_12195 [Ktedonobacterales bacterium]|nr:hypothetical protein [Ktedonobacterales bacterium]
MRPTAGSGHLRSILVTRCPLLKRTEAFRGSGAGAACRPPALPTLPTRARSSSHLCGGTGLTPLRARGPRPASGGTAPPQKTFVAHATGGIPMIEEGCAIWFKGWVRNSVALAATPAGEQFTLGQAMVWRRLKNGKWLVFDGMETYLILSTETARQALKSSRDAKGQPVPAEDQAAVEARFRLTLQRQRG